LQLRPISPTCLVGSLPSSRHGLGQGDANHMHSNFGVQIRDVRLLISTAYGEAIPAAVTWGARRNYEVGICEIVGWSFMGRCSPVGAERLWRWRWRWLRCVPSADHRAAVRPELSDGGRNCLPHLCDQTATCGTDSGVQIRDAGLFMSIATRTTSAS
jgi:hypothetical protein